MGQIPRSTERISSLPMKMFLAKVKLEKLSTSIALPFQAARTANRSHHKPAALWTHNASAIPGNASLSY